NVSLDPHNPEQPLGGTLPYMAPEQLWATDPGLTATHGLVDARSDLFSLGVILYELLTGTYPFGPLPTDLSRQELRLLLLERQRRGCQPVRRANRQVGRCLARVVERCLAYQPAERHQSATELSSALRRSLSWSHQLRHRLGTRSSLVLCTSLL